MLERFDQFMSSINSIYKTIQRIEKDEMAKYDLKGAHVQCLLVMQRYPQGVILSQLCDLCEKDKAAVSRTIAELEHKALVERWMAGEKLYRAPLRLTEGGLRIAGRIMKTVQTAVALAGAGLSDADRQVFYHALNLIAGNLARISSEGIPDTGEENRENEG